MYVFFDLNTFLCQDPLLLCLCGGGRPKDTHLTSVPTDKHESIALEPVKHQESLASPVGLFPLHFPFPPVAAGSSLQRNFIFPLNNRLDRNND
ncbi:hypothetical protein Y1Q_0012099 [Alligator mississippiensis]|uniref:Uncharacterized protein n=1 Tax=Alligator mississippiensis TaxID=8496 RepID=A0A151P5I5_ALLMI|nr:hypothetical protein Y1Q_0012099 [Alligator mississippiensis]